MSRQVRRATAIGGLAILLWSSLATLTVVARGIPPLELMAGCFAVAAGIGLVLRLAVPQWRSRTRLTLRAGLTTFCGLFFYHALYFYALTYAPADQVSLINYFWPLFIVILAAALPGADGLKSRHVFGALLGLAGTSLVLLNHVSAAYGSLAGYVAAFLGAVVWAGYSVVNQRHANIGSVVVLDICGAVAIAALAAHFIVESHTVMPNARQSLAIFALGLGPTGIAFVTWDYATKHGSLPIIGAISYFAPLLSTFFLISAGLVDGGPRLLAAAVLIMAGATIATGIRRQRVYPPG